MVTNKTLCNHGWFIDYCPADNCYPVDKSVYIAGASRVESEVRRAKRWMSRVNSNVRSLRVAHDWTAELEGTLTTPENLLDRAKYATADVCAVTGADFFWLLIPQNVDSHGAYFEFGVAATLKAMHEAQVIYKGPVVVVSGQYPGSIFDSFSDVSFFDEDVERADELAFSFIRRLTEWGTRG